MAIKELKINKRPRYFAGQYLLEDDFELEQDYARDRLQRYTRSLHVSGIADGLIATKPNDATLKLIVDISAGTAIDPQGRQVVLLESRQVDLTKDLVETVTLNNGDYILYIGYDEQESDPQDGSANTNRRILENPRFKLSSSAASDDFMAIAKLTIQDGIVSISSDSSVRKYTGLRLPALGNAPTLRSGGDRASNLAVLSGSLSVEGSLSVTGNVGIGTISQGAKLEVKGDTNDNNAAGLNVTDSKSKSLLYVRNDGNVGIGTTDPKQQLVVNSGKASIGYNDVQQTAAFAVNGNIGIGTTTPTEKLEISGGNLKVSENISAGGNLSVTGNVGIGTTNSNRKLTIKADYSASADAQQLLIQGTSNVNNQLAIGYHTAGNYGSIQAVTQNTSVRPLVLNPGGGNVGIGTTTPSGFQIVLPESSKGSSLLVGAGVTIAGGLSGNASIELRNAGTGTPYIDFAQNATTTDYDARIRLTEPGKLAIERANVGIGTTTPAANLQVRDTIGNRNNYDFSQTALLVNSQTNNGGNSPANAESVLALAREGVPSQSYGNMVDFRLRNYKNVGSVDGTQLDLYLTEGQFSPKQVMSLRANGNVGIGTPDPTGKLTVVGSEGNARSVIIDNKEIKFRGDGLAHFSIFANRWRDQILTIENTSAGAFPGVTNGTVLMALNSDGRLEVRGQVIGSVNFSSSDVRWKKNIETIASALDKVLQLRGVTFEWRKEEYQEMNFNSGKHLGLIAQEVEQVIPEVVDQNDEGYKSLAYSNLVALLIEALKELQAKHENLLPTMQAQQAEIEGLKTELNCLKALLITQPV